MYHLLDAFFVGFHAALVAFIVAGWAWPRARRLHLLVVLLMWLSWIGFGLVYGFGYCPLTDWHWQVKRALGETDLPRSYVKYYLDALTGASWDPRLVDVAVVLFGVAALAVSIWVGWRGRARAAGAGPRQRA